MVGHEREARLGYLRAHAGRAENEQALDLGPLVAQILDGSLGRGVQLGFGSGHPQLAKVFQIVSDALGRIVRKEGVPEAKFLEQLEEGRGGLEQSSSAI